jgi:hypothetical protein
MFLFGEVYIDNPRFDLENLIWDRNWDEMARMTWSTHSDTSQLPVTVLTMDVGNIYLAK